MIKFSAFDVWHGEKSMAMIRNNAGRYNERYGIANMFDQSPSTFWFSDSIYSSKIKTITIDFFVSGKSGFLRISDLNSSFLILRIQ